ncbi:hypothetical protein [Nonomuraea sp. LPB2021202275-12-8]|uniref:hypothetical protein n=1 Tax=Nonomuraea sp. LPB2021202275-12-8 TaxID=3120159 RepID=UPI00300D41AE
MGDSRERFGCQVLGPHFEELCREFARSEDAFGELPGDVGAGVITDPARREQIEVDVAVFAPAGRDLRVSPGVFPGG